jgi:hypothetical protein
MNKQIIHRNKLILSLEYYYSYNRFTLFYYTNIVITHATNLSIYLFL